MTELLVKTIGMLVTEAPRLASYRFPPPKQAEVDRIPSRMLQNHWKKYISIHKMSHHFAGTGKVKIPTPCRIPTHLHRKGWNSNPVVRVRIWFLTFWPQGQCMPKSYYVICLPTLVLIAQVVYLLERGQTHRQTDATERPNPRQRFQSLLRFLERMTTYTQIWQ